MLQIILLILKIIGWILLAILGILVLLVCAVLFTPLKYEIRGKCDGKLSTLNANIRFSYFLHLVSGSVQYADEKFSWKLRLAFKKLGSEEDEEKVVKEVTDKAETAATEVTEDVESAVDEKAEQEAESTVDSEKEEDTGDTADDKAETAAEETENTQNTNEKKITDTSADNIVEKEEKRRKKISTSKVRESILDKIDRFFEKIEYKFKKLCDKIKELIRKKDIVMDFLTNEIHKAAFSKTLSELKRSLIRLKPKKMDGEVEFGFTDPALTGKVLAGVSMIYPVIGDYVQIYPQFEDKVLKGNLHIKGKISARIFAALALRLILDKNIRITIWHIKYFKLK